jgi:hypothetical protein
MGPAPAYVAPARQVSNVPSPRSSCVASRFRAVVRRSAPCRRGRRLVWRMHTERHRIGYDPGATVRHNHRLKAETARRVGRAARMHRAVARQRRRADLAGPAAHGVLGRGCPTTIDPRQAPRGSPVLFLAGRRSALNLLTAAYGASCPHRPHDVVLGVVDDAVAALARGAPSTEPPGLLPWPSESSVAHRHEAGGSASRQRASTPVASCPTPAAGATLAQR